MKLENEDLKVVALAGGVGGAKLVHGLEMNLPSENLTVIVNTGDDFDHLGLYVCPDLDTVIYTLAKMANLEHGWGIENESWNVFSALNDLGAPTWFQLGDKDLATHLTRTHLLDYGLSLTEVTKYFCNQWNIKTKVLPMSDDPVRTKVHTLGGQTLSFQEYFVKEKCIPQVSGFSFEGQRTANPNRLVIESIREASFIVICPSNPWLSIDPILGIRDLKAEISKKTVIAISPFISGEAIKGPAAKICFELGIKSSTVNITKHYKDILSAIVFDENDSSEREAVDQLGIIPFITDTLMRTDEDRKRLASEILTFGKKLLDRFSII